MQYIWGCCVPIDTTWALEQFNPSKSAPAVFSPLSELKTHLGVSFGRYNWASIF